MTKRIDRNKRRYQMYLKGLSFSEVAEKEGIVEGTAKQSISWYHGFDILRGLLENLEAELGRKPYKNELKECLHKTLNERQKELTDIDSWCEDSYGHKTIEGAKKHQVGHEGRVYQMMRDIVGEKVFQAIILSINEKLDNIDKDAKIPESWLK